MLSQRYPEEAPYRNARNRVLQLCDVSVLGSWPKLGWASSQIHQHNGLGAHETLRTASTVVSVAVDVAHLLCDHVFTCVRSPAREGGVLELISAAKAALGNVSSVRRCRCNVQRNLHR